MSWKDLDDLDEKIAKAMAGDCTTPNPKVDVGDLIKKRDDAFAKFKEASDALSTKLEAYEDAIDTVKNGVKRVADIYAGFDFGKDPKKKDDAKKIAQAHQTSAAFFAKELKKFAEDEKDADELQKHLTNLTNYKGPGK